MKQPSVREEEKADIIQDFLASTHVFAAAVSDQIEDELLTASGGHEITPAQMKLLKLVGLTESQTIGGVAAFMGVSNAAASKGVDRLVKRHLLSRKELEKDRRVMHLSLTNHGREVLGAYEASRKKRLVEVFGDFPEGELEQASALMDRLSARIVESTAGSSELCLKCGIYFRRDCLLRKLQGRRCLYLQQNVSA